ncbi:MAG: HEAT repeat domain-containing protein [Desulfobacterales bacterium]|nr:HEAT repeat domain-containing protein [Desulfobacteraceae bacterium]MBT4365626.1 HEAT repeat domain-containing protein [Desulfobacteraceae bacterium]MBT7085136.1 HEAT repeat domain-containing protein [Desulfobacterales bacterium]MBT7696913.1 HEAT repeat domain-containing protein [Desulfobacterales bacterium]
MKIYKKSGRELKKQIHDLLLNDDFDKGIEIICRLPEKQAVNPLFSFFYSSNELLKWRAVTAMGAVVSGLADKNMEGARVIMRRLMWNLNDESGGIGWGSPEAMGEIMSRNKKLGSEYHKILISYMNPHGNYLEHGMLQRGLLWGVGRFASERPNFLKDSISLLEPFMNSDDPYLRGLSSWTLSVMGEETKMLIPEKNLSDQSMISFYINGSILNITIQNLLKLESDSI